MSIYNQLVNGLPKNWSEVSINNFIKLHTIDPELTQTERNIELLMILCEDVTDEEFDELTVDELEEVLKQIKWISLEPKNVYNDSIDEFTCLDMRQLTLGEFIELQALFKADFMNNLPLICSIMYRQHQFNEFGNPIIEPFATYDMEERANRFGDKPITEVYGIVSAFLKFKDQMFEAYAQMFNPINNEEFEEGYEPDEQDLKELEEEKKRNVWAWEAMIYNLADGDIIKMQEITKLPLIFVFNMLAMKRVMKF